MLDLLHNGLRQPRYELIPYLWRENQRVPSSKYLFHLVHLEKFVFDLYDTNKSGIISGEELETLAKDLFGGNVNSHVHAIVRELPKGDVEFHQFQHFLKKHEALMLPALELQSDLRRSVIHESFWVHKALDRRNVKLHLIDEALVLGHRVLKEQSKNILLKSADMFVEYCSLKSSSIIQSYALLSKYFNLVDYKR